MLGMRLLNPNDWGKLFLIKKIEKHHLSAPRHYGYYDNILTGEFLGFSPNRMHYQKIAIVINTNLE